ncbi:MAG: hypothetical protein ACYSU7_20175, partial [Planctomycetota bacterium]
MTRNERVIAGLCLAGAACLLAAPPAQAGVPGGAQFFTDPGLFAQTLQDINKVSKAQWDFGPHDNNPIIPGLDGPLDINTHGLDPDDPWTDAAGNNLWPPDVDNVQFYGNSTPGGPLTPVGVDALAFAHPGNFAIDNNALVSNFFVNSFDIVSGPPAGDNHTAMSFELISLAGPLPTVILVTVYDKNDVSLGVFTVDYQGGKVFLGILVGPGQTIGRVDIWDQSDGAEGISNFALYLQQEQLPWCPWDCAIPHDKVINVIDFLALLAGWGQPGPCDFDGGGVSVTDFLKLLAVWGPCPTPVNDECVDKIVLDRFDPAGQIIEHFDMYGATPSPEPLQC